MNQLSVIIADDDQLVLKDLKTIVKWETLGFHIVSMVNSGEDALIQIEKYRPNLLITDIQMMGMNGLDVIESAHKRYPEMKFLIISAYNDFNYAKRAIGSGVIDYILKTEITAPTFSQKLLEIKQLISKDSDVNYHLLERDFESFFSKEGSQLSDYETLSSYENTKYFFTYLTMPTTFSRNVLAETEKHRLILASLKPMICKIAIEYCLSPIICLHSSSLIVGISFDLSSSKAKITLREFERKLIYLLNNVAPQILHFYSIDKMDAYEYRTLIEALTPLLHYHSLFYPSAPIDIKTLSSMYYVPVDQSFSFHSILFDEDHQESNILTIKAYLEECFNDYDVYSLIHFYQKFCTHLEIISNNQIQLQNSLHASTPEYFQKWVYNTLNDCIQLVTRGLEYEYSPVVDSAIHFMHQNYSNFDLASANIADHVGLSVNRLSIVFKKETGKTINEYLNKIRVDKAVDLLEKTSMKIYEISEKCGYKSSQYFSQIIFQKTGKRPIDFRKAQR